MSDTQNMKISYFVSGANRNIAVIAATKNILPRPMGVKLEGIIERNKKFFGFTNYNRTTQSNLTTGFTNYTDGFTKEGETLTYEKVIIGFDPVSEEVLYGTRTCGYSDKVTYTSPLRMTLPEGLYRMNASGESKNVYVRGGNVNTIEITSNGFVGNTDDWK